MAFFSCSHAHDLGDGKRITAVAALVLALDLLSKVIVFHTLRNHLPIPLIPGFLQLVYGENTGIAFGLFTEYGKILHILTPLAFLALLVILYRQFAGSPLGGLLILIFGFIIGGALGNILNRLYCGYVIDFIDVYYQSYHWYTFNLADSALTIGQVLLIYILLFYSRSQDQPHASTPPNETAIGSESDSA